MAFTNGETIYDIDGNSYVVEGTHARLHVNGEPMMTRYDLSEGNMASCFLRLEDFEQVPYKLRHLMQEAN